MSSVSIQHEPPPPASQKIPRHNHLDTYRLNRERLYPNVTDEQWSDWKWQQKNRVTSQEQIVNWTMTAKRSLSATHATFSSRVEEAEVLAGVVGPRGVEPLFPD